ncbi:alpha-glucan family phosphorylase [Cloacibacillus porcorum]|uniref:alpha-glucan family phosphorylase n=1 Tax=Cloacibacillus porcorum TaxID=1197717 RepID=UPI0030B8C367
MINIAIHGHFYQPQREDPWTGTVLHDPTAAPAHDWNERVCSECYLQNSCARILGMDGRIKTEINNYARLSFNFGPTLHRWIENHSPSLNKTLIESQSRAIAQAYNHIIMPLASERDKLTQTVWGMEDFKYRFGHAPKGMWLPETAVDIPTLETLAARGVEFTILAPHQCRAVIIDSSPVLTSRGANLDVTRPYRCELPSGRSITIIFYHAGLAQGIAFGGLLNNGDLFKDAAVRAAAEGEDRILVTATDGESYGHHHKFGEMALARMFEQMELDERINLPSIEEFLKKHPPTASCLIEENTSWSCAHGIERWRSDCGCHTGGETGWNQEWRGPLREAFDNLAAAVDELFEEKISPYGDPWQLRNEAIELYRCGLTLSEEETAARRLAFTTERFGDISEEISDRITDLIEMERMRMFTYTSCAWFFNDISGVETKQIISYAIRAAQLAEAASGRAFIKPLLEDLKKARGNTTERPNAAAVAVRDIMPRMKEHLDMQTASEKNTDGSENMNGMNYGTNIASSLLATLEHAPAFRNTAYFSMEIALMPEIPTYSGGLGVLAGDILKSSADLGVPMVAMTLLYKKGYFAQKINKEGRQTEYPVDWNPRDFMTQLPNRVTITMNGHPVTIGAWCYMLVGQTEHPLPIYFIDTDLPENSPEDRQLTAELYGGDNKYRLCQELILGIGGLRLLRDMGYRNISTFHLNEGHAGFLTLELLREQGYGDIEKVKNQVIFTTHTPVAAGHDFFSYDLIDEVMDGDVAQILRQHVGGNGLSMTDLALKLSRYVNGVSHKHALVSRAMFGDESIDWITNGVHSTTWTSPSLTKLYDTYIPGWRNDPSRLMQALHIPDEELWNAHQAAKMKLLDFVLEETGQQLEPDVLTIGFARRAATYKRADLVFSDIRRLVEIGKGKVQFIFSGKAHPHDEPGKDILQKINNIARELGTELPVVFIENYNMGPAKFITSGVDVWLNTPIRPREASGTSGMKCVHNGIMNFSVLDGWWIEGCIEGKTGWAIGPEPTENGMVEYNEAEDAVDLYNKLEEKIIPTYYTDRKRWISMMKIAIAVNASYFNTHRVVHEYCEKAYGTVFRGH